MEGSPLFPEQASTIAERVDDLFFYLGGISAFFTALIFVVITVLAVRYRRRHPGERPKRIIESLGVELIWVVVPLLFALSIYAWGAVLYLDIATAPPESDVVYVTAKQWMWKLQHVEGQREINELHVPVGRPIKLVMTSEDVIHSFFVPAFRIKRDVLPGRFTTAWFEATKTGTFHLFCAEYCGTEHSRMIGRVVVMEPSEYQTWLEGGTPDESLPESGERLFTSLGCATCHDANSGARGPALDGVFGAEVRLQGGMSVIADETYIRNSILNPSDQLVAGYEAIMPTYKGQLSEEDIVKLISYIKSRAVRGEAMPR